MHAYVGKQVFEDGGSYEGEWVHGVQQGHGVYCWTWGDTYEGGWVNGKREGACIETYADGGRYEGNVINEKREGLARFFYGFGDSYEGLFANNLKVCGVWRFASGEVRVIRYVVKEGYTIIKGEGVKWSVDRQTAWRLRDGEVSEVVSLDEAAAIATRVSEGVSEMRPLISRERLAEKTLKMSNE